MIYHRDKNWKKRLPAQEADMITVIKKKQWFDVSSSKGASFQDMSQMTTIALISVINHYHINGLHLFWDTL